VDRQEIHHRRMEWAGQQSASQSHNRRFLMTALIQQESSTNSVGDSFLDWGLAFEVGSAITIVYWVFAKHLWL
jgi:hypothetical protein